MCVRAGLCAHAFARGRSSTASPLRHKNATWCAQCRCTTPESSTAAPAGPAANTPNGNVKHRPTADQLRMTKPTRKDETSATKAKEMLLPVCVHAMLVGCYR